MSRNATPSSFGWDFQVNAAIVLMLENIRVVKSVRVEGKKEDIELLLENEENIYAQAKSVVRFDDYRNVRSKLNAALATLNDDAAHQDYRKLIYVTNSPNPFKINNTMSAFYGHSRLSYTDLPQSCKDIIDLEIASKPLQHIDTSNLEIHVIPFFTDDFQQRYRVIKESVDNFLYELNNNTRGMADELLKIWQHEFFKNCTQGDLDLVIKKKDLMWSIIVLQSQLHTDNTLLEEYDDGAVDEIIRSYRYLINNRCEKFAFISQVVSDFQDFKSYNKDKKIIAKFIAAKGDNYKGVFELNEICEEVQDIVVKIILQKIIINRFLANDIAKKVNL
ncbi:MAG: hypothetical protein RR435_02570 [Erysipelotrichaceae bacterium]